MIVISVTSCPYALRGELTKWLEEIDVGVFVGNVSARVRDGLWQHVTDNIGNGRAVMVFNARNEQHLDFRVHNSSWLPIDFDGLKLMLRPNSSYAASSGSESRWRSDEGGMRIGKKTASRKTKMLPRTYIVIDVETTGLSNDDSIIEIGALKVEEGNIVAQFNKLIMIDRPLPNSIIKLTGITNDMIRKDGVDEKTALIELAVFSGEMQILSHNLRFDLGFLRRACLKHGVPVLSNRGIDTAELSRRRVLDIEDYKLSTLADYFSIKQEGSHRAIQDCITVKLLYDKLIENAQ